MYKPTDVFIDYKTSKLRLYVNKLKTNYALFDSIYTNLLDFALFSTTDKVKEEIRHPFVNKRKTFILMPVILTEENNELIELILSKAFLEKG